MNDTWGHDGGDAVLKEFASRLRKASADRSRLPLRREFVVVMPDTEGHIAEKVAERIRAEIEASGFAIRDDGTTIDVTASVGVSTLNRPHDSVQALMKRADLALYEAKSGGRNRVVAKAA